MSHAILQNRRAEADSITRVPASEIETLVRDGVRRHLGSMGEAELPTALVDRDLIKRHVARVVVKPQALEVCLIPTSEASEQAEDPSLQDPAPAAAQAGVYFGWSQIDKPRLPQQVEYDLALFRDKRPHWRWPWAHSAAGCLRRALRR